MSANVASRPVIIETPAAVAEADEAERQAMRHCDVIYDALRSAREALAKAREVVREGEEAEHSALLRLDTAARSAALARKAAGVSRTATGYIPAPGTPRAGIGRECA